MPNAFPCSEYGGRIALMQCLREFGEAANLPVVCFDGLDCSVVDRLRKRSDEIAQTSENWPLVDDESVERELAHLTVSVINNLGLPVMKLSYLDNSNPKALSFAGVGATSVPRSEITSLSRCFFSAINELGRPYAEYYRQQHPQFSSDRAGIMVMEHLPRKEIWATVWTVGESLIAEIQSGQVGVIHARVESPEEIHELSGKTPLSRQLSESIERIRTWTKALPPSDIEFCVDGNGLLLTQWRPIPDKSIPSIRRQLDFREGDCPPPYASSSSMEGVLRSMRKPDADQIDRWIESIADIKREGGILLTSYGMVAGAADTIHSAKPSEALVSLFDVLAITSKAGMDTLPPLLAVVDSGAAWGHLHAVTSEDRRVPFIGYLHICNLDDAMAHEGNSVTVAPDETGWMTIRHR